MEAPRFGFFCAKQFCNALDFVPAKCDHCINVFCGEHINYDMHNCPKPDARDVQVLICPLCNLEVPPTTSGYTVELTSIEHVDQHCQSDMAVARRKWVINLMRSCAWR